MEKGKFNMKLNIRERLILIGNMPKVGSLKEMRAIRSIINLISIKEDDIKEYNITEGDKEGVPYTTWNSSKDIGKDYDFTAEEVHVLKETILLIDEAKAVDLYMLELIDKIETL